MAQTLTLDRRAEKPLWRALLLFLLPLLGSNALQSLSQTLTSIYLGRLLGTPALAAVSSFFPFMFFLLSFMIGFAGASSILIGQAYGARDPEKIRVVAGTTLTVVALIGSAIALLGGFFAEPMLRAAGTPADILADATRYARISLLGQPLFGIYIAYTMFLRGTGDAHTPFYALVLTTALSLGMTPVLIEGWLGLPPLGVASGAYSGVFAYAVTLTALGIHLARRRHPLAPTRALAARLRIDWTVFKTLVRLGIPGSMQMVLISLAEIAVLAFVNGFGSTATAAYGAVNQIVSYVQLPGMSMGMAASIFGAQAIGRGHADRLGHITRTAILLNLAIGGTLITLSYLFERSVVSLFITDRPTLEIAVRLLQITLWSYILFGLNAIVAGIMRSSGAVLWPTLISVATIWLVEVPVAYALKGRLGLDGVWLSYPVTFAIQLALQSGYYRFVWRRQRVERLV